MFASSAGYFRIIGYSRIIPNSWNRIQNTESYSGLN